MGKNMVDDDLNIEKEEIDNKSVSEESQEIKTEKLAVKKKPLKKKVSKKKVSAKKPVKRVIKRKQKKKNHLNWKKPLLIIILLIIIIISSFLYLNKNNTEDKQNYVAFVDGTPITEKVIMSQKEIMSIVRSDLTITDDMALNQTIIMVLFLNEADKNNIIISDEIIESNIQAIQSRFNSEEDFYSALEIQNTTIIEFRKEISNQFKIEQLREMIFSDISITDDEIKDSYLQNQEQLLANGYENYSSAKTDLKEILLKAKQNQLLNDYILFLMNTAKIEHGPFTNEDLFAICLSNSDAIFYTSYWCEPCKKQEEIFQTSYKFINSVDCSTGLEQGAGQISICDDNNIEVYPTWVINGQKYTGIKSLDFLSEKTSCKI